MILFYSENRRGNPQGELYLTELFIVCNEQIYDRRLYDPWHNFKIFEFSCVKAADSALLCTTFGI